MFTDTVFTDTLFTDMVYTRTAAGPENLAAGPDGARNSSGTTSNIRG